MKGLLLMISFLWLDTPPAGAQNIARYVSNARSINALGDLAAPYFKTHPYNKSFSVFLQDVLNDPDLQKKVVNRRTDSTFFFVSGTYQRYNPFVYRPTSVRLAIAESEFTDSDTSCYRDTVVYCQLLVTADSTEKARQFVQKEYSRLLRKASRFFTHKSYTMSRANRVAEGEVTDSFISPFAVSPLTIGWGREAATRAYIFSVTLLLKVNGNWAEMVTLPQEPIRAGE
ncbi:MAG TPA: hypothetical protein VGE66_15890 [Chitinophagaceae bacterium]